MQRINHEFTRIDTKGTTDCADFTNLGYEGVKDDGRKRTDEGRETRDDGGERAMGNLEYRILNDEGDLR